MLGKAIGPPMYDMYTNLAISKEHPQNDVMIHYLLLENRSIYYSYSDEKPTLSRNSINSVGSALPKGRFCYPPDDHELAAGRITELIYNYNL
jgi:hypothetical protein